MLLKAVHQVDLTTVEKSSELSKFGVNVWQMLSFSSTGEIRRLHRKGKIIIISKVT
jgi:hypothetical protein